MALGTGGRFCQECLPLYNSKPYLRGTPDEANPCVACDCNGHSDRCRYDANADASPGSRILGGGGVCVDCSDNTEGQRCQRCVSEYFRTPATAMDSPRACTKCNCHPSGASSNVCSREATQDSQAGQCPCLATTEGRRCNTCKDGFFGLGSSANGCTACDCDDKGTIGGAATPCYKTAGQCTCKKNVEGRRCDKCRKGYTDLARSNKDGCTLCYLGDKPNTYRFSNQDNECVDCHYECIGCNGPNNSQCKACRNVFYAGRCVSECPPNHYADADNKCQRCHPQCQGGCKGPEAFQCSACRHFVNEVASKGLSLEVCVKRCPVERYGRYSTQQCLDCNENCNLQRGCRGPAPSDCEACAKFKHLGACVPACPALTYADRDNECRQCHPQCGSGCSGPEVEDCQDCKNFKVNATGLCVPGCPPSTYESADVCLPCDSECRVGCFGPGPSQCSERCTDGQCVLACKNFQVQDPERGLTCVAACPPSFAATANTVCQPCHPLCHSCTTPELDGCVDCTYVQSFTGRCLAKCPVGQVAVGGDRVCTECHEQCAAGCTGITAADCNACKTAEAQDGTCVSACPAAEYSEQGRCADCHPQCAAGCTGPSALLCKGGLCASVKTFSGACAQTCWDDRGAHPAGYFPALEAGQAICRPCDTMCGAGEDSCCYGAGTVEMTAAEPRKTCGYLSRGNETKCLPCDVNCEGCTGPLPSQCLACVFAEHEGECVPKCPPKMVRNSLKVCTACPDGTINKDGACVPCLEGAHYTDAEGRCQPCDPECNTCTGPTAEECTLPCKNFQVSNERGGHTCVASCSNDHYSDGISCLACHPHCQGCRGPLDTDCKACRHHEVVATGQCVETCPAGSHGSLGVPCVDCHPECRSCSDVGRDACGDDCANVYDQATGSCASSCSRVTVQVDVGSSPVPQCKPCLEFPGRVQGKDACLAACPSGQYATAGRECEPCNGLCQECNGPGLQGCTSCKYATLIDGTCAAKYVHCPPTLLRAAFARMCISSTSIPHIEVRAIREQ